VRSKSFAIVVVAAVAAAGAHAAETPPPRVEVDVARSAFAVLTHKAGFASALAHDHLIAAPAPKVDLSFDPEHPEATRLTFETAARDLEVDANERRRALGPRLVELGIYREPLPDVPEGHRKKVFDAALAPGQLDAARFPEIRAELRSVARRVGPPERGVFDWTARVAVTIHGRTIERDLAARFRVVRGEIEIESLGEFRFREFGVEPYSAFAGAVRNEDAFEIYVRLIARAGSGSAPG